MCVIIALQYKSIEQKSYSYSLPTNKYFLTTSYNEWQGRNYKYQDSRIICEHSLHRKKDVMTEIQDEI